MSNRFIAIEGNIGAGKTSLARLLANELNAQLILEQFEKNSFLPLFYKEPQRYAFPLEMSFLADRYQQLKSKLSSPELFQSTIVADYFISKSLIFARKTLQDDEYKLYSKLFSIISSSLRKPDLLVYLFSDIPRLRENIRNRGRDYEQEIDNEYLEKIQSSYFEFIHNHSNMAIVIIDNSKLDFVNKEEDFAKLKEIIMQKHSHGIHRYTLE
ncbi:MAG: deoxynucleoside kinase [Bacteroidales bacterium]|nr:deoxynucleoside kinase [Bacteroidales bacterium]MCF8327034.1 deoxynucleoside kinase [Bacteroidales bacterium]